MSRQQRCGQAATLLLAVPLAVLLAGCAPSLNWRAVQLGRLGTLLPCKPDHGSRPVELAGQPVTMEMSGCAVGEALFTISRIQAGDTQQASTLLVALRQATLAQVHAAALHPLPNSGDSNSSLDLQVDALGPQGRPLQVRLKWLLVQDELYQLAAYAEQLGAEQTENLFQQARIY